MQNLQHLLDQYGESHQNSLNQKIHKICVPLIEWSLLGLLWVIPQPEFFGNLHWTHVFVAFAFIYYAQFRNLKLILASLLLMLPFWIYISLKPAQIFETSLVIFIIAWFGQFYGHKVEGKKPSFFQDIFFLLIGPIWISEALLKKWGRSLT